MIENVTQLKIAVEKINDLKESMQQDFSEIPSDVRDEIIRQRLELIAELEQEVRNYECTKVSEDQSV